MALLPRVGKIAPALSGKHSRPEILLFLRIILSEKWSHLSRSCAIAP